MGYPIPTDTSTKPTPRLREHYGIGVGQNDCKSQRRRTPAVTLHLLDMIGKLPMKSQQ